MALTHLVFGFLTALFAVQFIHPHNQVLFVILIVFASLLPDLDHPKSKLGRKTKIFAWLFEHRGFMHSIYAVIIIFMVSKLIFGDQIYVWALPIGYLSHLVADSMSKEGIMFFHPLSKARIRGMIKTGSSLEYVLLIVLFVLSAWKLLSF
ncbi:MAG: metal-dependent hydrolase [Nanoarchaeota archaeon]|nr:metal-dependent hydrolase [Nanoarchaeota archaeon]